MLYDGLIFDLDGTLWDSTKAVSRAWTLAVNNLGDSREITPSEVAGIMGMPHQKIFETMFPDSAKETREGIAKECYTEEISLIRKEGAALYLGVQEGLAKLAERYPLYIVSNCQTDYLDSFLHWTGFNALFEDSECHGTTGKTKAENIVSVKSRNHLAAPAYIGDTASDEAAARRAGVDYFHVTYGFGSPQSDCTQFKSFPDLVEYFLLH